MNTSKRLTDVYKSSKEIPFDDSSRLIFFSDCHRGDNSWADDFTRNRQLFLHALNYYYHQGFTYIEVGDGDELWKNRHFSQIRHAHGEIFDLLKAFHAKERLYMIFGNHDMIKKSKSFVQKNLQQYYDYYTGQYEALLPGMEPQEGLLFRYSGTSNTLFVVHGHQGDLINDTLWLLARFLLRYIWRQLELLGFKNMISPVGNSDKINLIEKRILDWVSLNKQPIITGHTHKPMFPAPGRLPYFNTGSCVHPGYITGIEIQAGEILLVKWKLRTREDGVLKIGREVVSGPQKLQDFFDRL